MDTFADILRSIPWYAWIAIVAILSGAVTSIVAQSNRHEQRMEMIKRGMDPNSINDGDAT